MTCHDFQICPQTQEALKTNLTLRLVLRDKYLGEKSRRSAVVIPWAQKVAEKLGGALVRAVGPQTTGFSIQLNMIQMLDIRDRVHICYDLFLDECDQGLRAEISGNFHVMRPIHFITKRHKLLIIRRDARLDAEVLRRLSEKSKKDKGPLPYFWDGRHPPVYDENGIRLIEYEERTERFPAWMRENPETEGDNWTEGQDLPAEGDASREEQTLPAKGDDSREDQGLSAEGDDSRKDQKLPAEGDVPKEEQRLPAEKSQMTE